MLERLAEATAGRVRRAPGTGAAGACGSARAGAWLLVAVAVCFTLVQMSAVTLRMPLGWDEAVYASQFGNHAPAAYFSAPRARGISWLAAPAVLVTGSVVVLRCWMSLLAATGLVAAYWPWRRLVGDGVAALAAALFAGLWVVQFYAAEVMPNLYVAFGAVGTAGWFLRAVDGRGPAWRWRTGVAAGLACVALIRPPDAGWLTAVLLVAAAVVPGWRRAGAALWAVGGAVVGLVPWVVESFRRFGGPLARLRTGSEVQGGMGWHLAFGMELRAVDGPMLCRPCTAGWPHPVLTVWWLLLPVVALAGLALAARRWRDRLGPLVLASACAVVMSVQYLFLLDYAATRFLMPSYALLALPVAAFGLGAPGALRGRAPRLVAAGLLSVLLVAQLAGQYAVVRHLAAGEARQREALTGLAVRLNSLGLRAPCALVGTDVPPLAFEAGCSSEAVAGNNVTLTPAGVVSRAAREPLAAAQLSSRAPGYARRWPRCTFVLTDGAHWYVFRPPPPARRWGPCRTPARSAAPLTARHGVPLVRDAALTRSR
ncbi:hypothetical protein [Streptantibioticus silvisoli]|uniref:Glycosyltransferase RgtA/B/C/D-like domain-containing protein n=1 Tax=Streptantibioticus silvisoli TaxID=2705255 RepID=A0ABT6W6J7_9ACTN|nr:hypothetical protein [Streptantibioticus silvisoli]MDI5966365.1 hypothetical protein [Streptantibioticus silvisoli]